MEGGGRFGSQLNTTRALKCSSASSLAGEKNFTLFLFCIRFLFKCVLVLFWFTTLINVCFSLQIFAASFCFKLQMQLKKNKLTQRYKVRIAMSTCFVFNPWIMRYCNEQWSNQYVQAGGEGIFTEFTQRGSNTSTKNDPGNWIAFFFFPFFTLNNWYSKMFCIHHYYVPSKLESGGDALNQYGLFRSFPSNLSNKEHVIVVLRCGGHKR